MIDPLTQYLRSPFPKQEQPWPGLAGKMNPRRDHGETSYRGSGRLAGRKALITGGDSGIGRAAPIAFAREGADVAIGYLPQEQPDADDVIALIRQAGRKAVPLPGDIRNEDFCRKLVADAAQWRNLSAVTETPAMSRALPQSRHIPVAEKSQNQAVNRTTWRYGEE